MSKVLKYSLYIILSSLIIFLFLFFLSNSKSFEINEVIVKIDKGEIPPSIIKFSKEFKHKNILKINSSKIDCINETNAFILESKTKITISKKLIISLKKNEVDAIIKKIESDDYYLLRNESMKYIETIDKSIIDNNLLLIEVNDNVIESLVQNEELIKFHNFINYIDILYDYHYLISCVKYDNNVNNSFGFFELKLKNKNNILIRVRDKVDTTMIENALKLSQSINSDEKNNKVLDVYHGAIVLRNLSFGG